MKGLKAIFFDAGHTLLRAHPSVAEIYARVTRDLGVDVSPRIFEREFMPLFMEYVKEYVADPRHVLSSDEQDVLFWRGVLRKLYERLSEVQGLEFERWFQSLYSTFGGPEVWRLYEDVPSVLEELRRRRYRLGIVSNWDTRLRGIAAGLGLESWVDVIVISSVVGVRKPDPRIFQRALEAVGVAPREALHVGDLPEEDIEGARGAGLHAAWINRENRIALSVLPEGVLVLNGLSDLLTHLE